MVDAPEAPAASRAVEIDPGVELLPDVPVSRSEEDLLGRLPLARRLCELACAHPVAAPRVVGLAGGAGAGKSSVLNLVAGLLADRPEVAFVAIDAGDFPGTSALLDALIKNLMQFFADQDVIDTRDAVRDALSRYGSVISGAARIAGVKVDLGGLSRSPEEMRAELAEMTQEVGKRIVLLLDHVDRLHPRELASTLVALRHVAAIPYVTVVLAYDRRAVAAAPDDMIDPRAFERVVQVELALPPADRVLVARVLAGGVARIAARTGRDLDAALPLFDPDAPDGAPLLDLCETPRDAKRAINALAAALPLVPAGAAVDDAALDIALRLLVPELDSARLDARRRVQGTAGAVLLAELDAATAGHRLVGPARAALRALFALT